MIDFTMAEFYLEDYRSQFEIVDRKKVNELVGHEDVLEKYEIHLFIDGYANVFDMLKNRYLKPCINSQKDKYYRYNLVTDNGTLKCYMHRLIGLAFIDGYKEGYIVNHRNLIKQKSHIDNLEWITNKENTQHAQKNGAKVGKSKTPLHLKPIKKDLSKLNISQSHSNGKGKSGLDYHDITKIFDLAEAGYKHTGIAEIMGVSQPAISQIINGKRWVTHPRSIEYNKIKAVKKTVECINLTSINDALDSQFGFRGNCLVDGEKKKFHVILRAKDGIVDKNLEQIIDIMEEKVKFLMG